MRESSHPGRACAPATMRVLERSSVRTREKAILILPRRWSKALGHPHTLRTVSSRPATTAFGRDEALNAQSLVSPHALLRTIYLVLKTGQPYQEPLRPALTEDRRDRKTERLSRELRNLGYDVILRIKTP